MPRQTGDNSDATDRTLCIYRALRFATATFVPAVLR